MNILMTGRPGTGKSWVMTQLIKHYECTTESKIGLINFVHNNSVLITGVYDGSTFQGSDRLSMAAIGSVDDLITSTPNFIRVFEGDRFTNKTMLQFSPIVINIEGDGAEGIKKRGSSQTEARLKSMATRYNNYSYNYRVKDSDASLELVKDIIDGKVTETPELQSGNGQFDLF